MNLAQEINAMETIVEKQEQNQNEKIYLNVNTVMDAISRKQEEILTLQEIYQVYPDAALKELQSIVISMAREAVDKQHNYKDTMDIILPSNELVSKSDILEAVERMEESIDYHQEKIKQRLEHNATELEQYLKKRNMSKEYIREVKSAYVKEGALTETLEKDILKHITDFLVDHHESESTIQMVSEITSKDLKDLENKFLNFRQRFSEENKDSNFLLQYSNISYIPLSSYPNTLDGLYHFARDYGISKTVIDDIIKDDFTTKNKEVVWNILVQNKMVNPSEKPEIISDIRSVFEEELGSKVQKVQKEEHHGLSAQQEFTNLCRGMSISYSKIDELTASISKNNGKLMLNDGRSIYKVLKEDILPEQQKRLPVNGSKEEKREAYLKLIKERQQFFQNIYKCGAEVKKDPHQIIGDNKGKKIIKSQKNNSDVSKSIVAATFALEKNVYKKLKEKIFGTLNQNIKLGSMAHLKGVEVQIEAIEIYDTNSDELYYSKGETLKQMIKDNKINPNHKLQMRCYVVAENGFTTWVEYPSRDFVVQEETTTIRKNQVK